LENVVVGQIKGGGESTWGKKKMWECAGGGGDGDSGGGFRRETTSDIKSYRSRLRLVVGEGNPGKIN